MITIKCPKCTTEGKMSLVDPNYDGPYKCWKCRELFTLRIQGDAVVSCEPLSQEEYDKTHPPKAPSNMNISNARFGGGGDSRRGLF